MPRRLGLAKLMHLSAVGADLRVALSQTLLLVAFLPHQTCVMVEAILRTLFRLLVSRRNLLEWTTAAQAKVKPRVGLIGFYWQMGVGYRPHHRRRGTGCVVQARRLADRRAVRGLVAAVAGDRAMDQPAVAGVERAADLRGGHAGAAADRAPHLVLSSRRSSRRKTTCCRRTISRKTQSRWSRIGHRPPISGLYLLSVVAAADFGWIGILETVERLEATLGR